MKEGTSPRLYCPHCEQVHEHSQVGQIGATQADGCDVDCPTWKCSGCGAKWNGEGYDAAPAMADVSLIT